MKTEETVDSFANARAQGPVAEFEVGIEHGAENKIAENEGNELHRRLFVRGAADAAGSEIVGKEILTALHTRDPKLAGEVGKVVRLGDEDAIEGEKLRRTKHAENAVADVGEGFARRIRRLDVLEMQSEELLGMQTHDTRKQISLRRKEHVERLFRCARAAGNLAGRGACVSIFEEDRGCSIQDAPAFGVVQWGASAGGSCDLRRRNVRGSTGHILQYLSVQLISEKYRPPGRARQMWGE